VGRGGGAVRSGAGMKPPVRALLILGVLVVAQASAFAAQIVHGFRPFGAAPSRRVPFSWDMFALRIECCDVTWTPPVVVDGRPFPSISSSASGFEWGYVLNKVASYRQLALALCAQKTVEPTRAVLRCATSEGVLTQEEIPCPP